MRFGQVTKLLCAAAAGALISVSGGNAARAETFLWTFTGNVFSGSGTLTGDLTSPGTYHVTNMDGTFAGETITGVKPDSAAQGGNDNELFTTPPGLTDPGFDSAGLSFVTEEGNTFNLHGSGVIVVNSILGGNSGTFSLSEYTPPVAQTPLPGALPLFTSALAGIGLISWFRKRKAALAE